MTVGGMDVCGWPGRGFAMIYYSVGRIDYYDYEFNPVRLAEVPSPSEAFRVDDEGNQIPNADKVHYRACEVLNDRLFVLYSGREENWEAGDQYEGETVHVFDWEGQFLLELALDTDVSYIDIAKDSTGTVIYGSSQDDAKIYRFQLPASDLW